MKKILNDIFKSAIHHVFGDLAKEIDPSIQVAARPEFGDYQANFAMRLAKMLNKKPIDVANVVIEQLRNQSMFKKLEASGPGFINIFLTNEYLAENLQALVEDERLGIPNSPQAQIVVVDYANANVAKEMHVGHIRSIVIGDAIVRILSFLGHQVIRQSHLGDWGTQFGMLIEYLIEAGEEQTLYSFNDLDAFYKKSKQRFDTDAQFADKARARVVALQNGDATTLAIWKRLVAQSLQYFQKIYEKLDVLITEADARGESFYNPFLADVITELKNKSLAFESDGATVIFLDGFEIPYLIRKKDGGYLYSTTDLAAAKFRIEQLNARRLIYLTDARQKQHFAMLFATVYRAGWVTNDKIKLEHIPFGAILGPDNKPFKTRTGESIKLIALLDEAESRALAIAKEKNPTLAENELKHIAHHIGIGALKYADLRADKIKDYVFEWDKLLSFEGNTAPYLQNAYVRIRSIFRKGSITLDDIKQSSIIISTDIEHTLAVKLLAFTDMLYDVANDLSLHRVCDYLYDLAATYHRFYEACPILSNENQEIRQSRLLLSNLTARTLKLGLNLLGITTLDKM